MIKSQALNSHFWSDSSFNFQLVCICHLIEKDSKSRKTGGYKSRWGIGVGQSEVDTQGGWVGHLVGDTIARANGSISNYPFKNTVISIYHCRKQRA